MNYFSVSQRKKGDDEAWIFSYADLMTLLLGFFIILYSFSSVDDKKFDEMSKQFSETFKGDKDQKKSDSDVGITHEKRQLRALQMLVAMLNLGSSMDDAVATIERSFSESESIEKAKEIVMSRVSKKDLDKVGARTVDLPEKVEIILPAAALFNSGQYSLTPQARQTVASIAAEIAHAGPMLEIEVVGHTDQLLPNRGSILRDNFSLSSARAGAVATELIKAGVNEKILSVRGMGALEPLFPETGVRPDQLRLNRQKNRRVHIILRKPKSDDSTQ